MKHRLPPAIRKRPWRQPCSRSKRISARAVSCAWGIRRSMNVEAIPTGSLALDLALGIGGVPRGRIIEIYGPESSGKTTLALHILAQAQKRGGEVAFVDAEHALDPVYATGHGRGYRLHAGLPAGHRRAGAGDHRRPGALRRAGRRRRRLCRGADAPGGDRGRNGRQPLWACRPG